MNEQAATSTSPRHFVGEHARSRSRSIQRLLVLTMITGMVVALITAGVVAEILSLVTASGH